MDQSTKYFITTVSLLTAILTGAISLYWWAYPNVEIKYNVNELNAEQKEELKANATTILSNQFEAYLEGIEVPHIYLESYMKDIRESAVPTKKEVTRRIDWSVVNFFGGISAFFFLITIVSFSASTRIYLGLGKILEARANNISRKNKVDQEMYDRFVKTMDIMEKGSGL